MVKQFWKLMKCLCMKTDIALLNHFVKMCYVVTFIYYKFFTLLSVAYICCTWCLEKYTNKIVHIIINIVIHSSFCVLNLVLPEHRPFFAKVTHTR